MPSHGSYVWQISLKPHLSDEQLQISVYDIAEELGMSTTTIYRFIKNDIVIVSQLSPNVGLLARYYGVDVNDVISLVENATEDEDEGIIKEALSA